MLCHVALVRTDKELSASIIRVTRISKLGTLAVSSNQRMLRRNTKMMMEVLSSSKTSVLTRATQHDIPEDRILHIYRHENLKSYTKLLIFSSGCQYSVMVVFILGNSAYQS
jgi:hypothetical protein